MTRTGQRGQSTVETALVLPVVLALLLVVVQAGLLVRDRVLVVHGARVAARAVVVDPSAAAARAALADAGLDRFTVQVSGVGVPGGLATVTVQGRPSQVPLVGRAVAGILLRERLTVRVEER